MSQRWLREKDDLRYPRDHVVGFYKDHGKTKPITKSEAQLNRKKIVKHGKPFKGVKPGKVHYNWTTGNLIIDGAIIGLAAGVISYEIAWYHANGSHIAKK